MSEPESNSIKALEGKTSIDQTMFFEPELLSYQAAQHVAQEIAKKLEEQVKNKTVVLVDDALLTDLANIEAAYLLLDGLRQDYEALARSAIVISGNQKDGAGATKLAMMAVPAALTALSGQLGATLGLLSLFREDTDYQGRKTNIDPTAFQLILAGELKAKQANKVILPRLLSPKVDNGEVKSGSLQARLNEVHNIKQEVWENLRPSIKKLAELDADLDAAARAGLQAEVDKVSQEFSMLRHKLDPVTDPLSRLDSRLNEIETQWQRVDEKTGLTPLSRILRAEAVRSLNPIYVFAGVVSAGGSYRIKRSLWSSLFTGDSLSFSGGVVVMWATIDEDGSIYDSGVERCLLPFRRFKEVSAPLEN